MATALTDATLRSAMLVGDSTAFAGFDLTVDEVAHLQTISATTLEDFARQAHLFFYGEDPLDERADHCFGHPSHHTASSVLSAFAHGGAR
jgi:hypothetical protein